MDMVALLRGINVGGGNKLAMAGLRGLMADLGFEHVETYIQSGNVVFSGDATDAGEQIRTAIKETFGLAVSVVTRTAPDLHQLVATNPYDVNEIEGRLLHVVFLADTPAPAAVACLDPDRSPPDEFHVIGREVYAHFPNGSGRSKLTIAYFERTLETTATMRNWNTVMKLVRMLAAREGQQGMACTNIPPDKH